MRRYVPRTLVTTALAATFATATDAVAQAPAGPPQVLVPALMVEGVDGRVGERVSAEVRDLMEDLSTHGVVSEKDLKAAMARYRLEELDEITARQLAQQMNSQIVMWGTVARGGQGLQADVRFIDVRTGDQLQVEDATGSDHDALAAAIVAEFREKSEGLRLAVQCGEQVMGQQFEAALASCDQALALVPLSSTALAGRAAALSNLQRWPEAATTYAQLLEVDPANQEALIGAGLAASRAGNAEEAAGFYTRYLEINGGDLENRMTLTGRIIQAGDFVSAFRVLEPVIAENRANAELQKNFLLVATAAGQQTAERDSVAARAFYQAGLQAYQALVSSGGEIDAAATRQAIAINNALGNRPAALQIAREATTRFASDASIWSQYASVLEDEGQYAEAVEALTRAIQLDPELENVYVRRGSALLRAGQRDQAIADFQQAVSRGNGALVGQLLYANGAQAYQANRFDDAVDLLTIAEQNATGDTQSKIRFLLGVSLYRQGEEIAKANTQARAAEARRALSSFERAVAMLQATQEPQAAGVLSAAQQYVTNQQAIVAAGR